ncbi:hypothetical protein [Streptomyces sp. NPDC056169]|uniref:hypothetical protein n=1 Tax=Streptomyces sp. NPDC056169 TaxID=3345734 RepID=UPI0035D5E4F3
MRIPLHVLRQWRPDQTRKTGYLPIDGIAPHLNESDYSTRIRPGTIIVFGERRAHEVIDVQERPLDLWPDLFNREWDRYTTWWAEQVLAGHDMGNQPEKSTWEHRPVVLSVRAADQPTAKPNHYAIRAGRTFYVLPEHYSVCRLCNEIPPCTHATTEAQVEHAVRRTDELMAIPAGACLFCGQAITSRMNATRFPGPNLWRPDLGNDSAVFHARRACEEGADSYRRQWQDKGHSELQAELPGAAGDDS